MQFIGLVIFIIVAIIVTAARRSSSKPDNKRSSLYPYGDYDTDTRPRERMASVPAAPSPIPRTSYVPTVHAADFQSMSQLTSTDYSGASGGTRTKIVHSEAVAPKAQAQSAIDLNEAMNAIVLGEILSKPKALRR